MLSLLGRSVQARSFLWLLAATPLLFVATGLWSVPIAAWLAPMFLLRFVRNQPTWRGCAIATLLRQAGRQSVDLLVVLSNDWAAIAERHAHMARIRAIENGTALLRPTSNGLTLATGPLSQTHARMDHVGSGRRLQIAHVPVRSAVAPYPFPRDALAWICGLGLLLLIGRARRRPPTLSHAELV